MFSFFNKKKKRLWISVLTSFDSERLVRAVDSIYKQDQELFDYKINVVVNTPNKDYMEEVQKKIKDNFNDINVIETESNGKTGRGKNSAIELFKMEKENFDYIFLIDGDDFLYPTAFEQLNKTMKKKPDVLGLQSSDIFMKHKEAPSSKLFHKIEGDVYLNSWGDREENLMIKFPKDINKKVTDQYPPDRILLLSSKIVEENELFYPENLKAFEDYAFSVKALMLSYENGYKYLHINNSYIYAYDKTNENAVTRREDDYEEQIAKINRDFPKTIERALECGFEMDFKMVDMMKLQSPKNFGIEEKINFIKGSLINCK